MYHKDHFKKSYLQILQQSNEIDLLCIQVERCVCDGQDSSQKAQSDHELIVHYISVLSWADTASAGKMV